MKKLYIVRHSKAVEYADDHSDFNRCLANYGIEKATLIAKSLAAEIEHVDLALSSPACRALETARIFSTALQYDHTAIETDESLYHFGGIERSLNTIAAVDDNVETLILFGHNPTFTALAWYLCAQFQESMPTSAVVGISLKIKSWSEIYVSKGQLLSYRTKKNLR